MDNSKYTLHWSLHNPNLISYFEKLYSSEAFSDVTLSLADFKSIKSHRVVLAANSPYLEGLLSVPENMEEDSRPIIVLPNISFSYMKLILEFMYKGKVDISYGELAGFLQVAEMLKVKGIVGFNSNNPYGGEVKLLLPTTSTSKKPEQQSTSSAPRDPNPNAQTQEVAASEEGGQSTSQGQTLTVGNEMIPPYPQDSETVMAMNYWAMLLGLPFYWPGHELNFSGFNPGSFGGYNYNYNASGQINPEGQLPSQHTLTPSSSTTISSPAGSTGTGSESPKLSKLPSQRVKGQGENKIIGSDKYRLTEAMLPNKRFMSNINLAKALEAVRGGMSAYDAAPMFKVTYRTLYEKCKKAGLPNYQGNKRRKTESLVGSSTSNSKGESSGQHPKSAVPTIGNSEVKDRSSKEKIGELLRKTLAGGRIGISKSWTGQQREKASGT